MNTTKELMTGVVKKGPSFLRTKSGDSLFCKALTLAREGKVDWYTVESVIRTVRWKDVELAEELEQRMNTARGN